MGEDGVLIHLWFPNEFLFKHCVGFLHFPHPSRASNVPKWVTLFTEIISSLDAHKWVTLFTEIISLSQRRVRARLKTFLWMRKSLYRR